ncbi:hypothetical protein AB4305_32305 [Nocardia sp. 2YAB30]|uniref:hypothetical protein n=1 Tax=Nocardia sp. 2YAB30 TaxID=3233022 RepID=UPI003F95C454
MARPQTVTERDLIGHAVRRRPLLGVYLRTAFGVATIGGDGVGDIAPELAQALARTSRSTNIGAAAIAVIVRDFTADRIDLDFMAVWLMLISLRGLSTTDTRALTLAMRDTGRVYDYRGLPELDRARVVRRYPTGAVSEKAALILPAMLGCVDPRHNIVSPFLVARSLGFTGGTWDKLSAIPGFAFPAPGQDTVRLLRSCRVAMSVTLEDFNPADRKMYQFRSVTGTIPAPQLIVASIASKMMACPADHLLMDVRYGTGAFLASEPQARRVATLLCDLITEHGTPTTSMLTCTDQPTGTAVGNAVEVLEAIAVMKPLNPSMSSTWDERALHDQRRLVIALFAQLMSDACPDLPCQHWSDIGGDLLSTGAALGKFGQILHAHGVERGIVRRLLCDPDPDPDPVIGSTRHCVPVPAAASGILTSLDQKRLGHFVNFELGAGGNTYAGSFDKNAGLILHKRLGDTVEAGDVLATVRFNIDPHAALDEKIFELTCCFVISEGGR